MSLVFRSSGQRTNPHSPRLVCRAISRAIVSMEPSISRSIAIIVCISAKHEQCPAGRRGADLIAANRQKIEPQASASRLMHTSSSFIQQITPGQSNLCRVFIFPQMSKVIFTPLESIARPKLALSSPTVFNAPIRPPLKWLGGKRWLSPL